MDVNANASGDKEPKHQHSLQRKKDKKEELNTIIK